MTTEEILAKATPRPWRRVEAAGCKLDHEWSHHPCNDIESAVATWSPDFGDEATRSLKIATSVISSWGHDADGVEAKDEDLDLIVLAVNSYEADQRKIAALTNALRAAFRCEDRAMCEKCQGKAYEALALAKGGE